MYVCLSHECQSPPKCRCRHQNSCCLRPTFFKLCKDRITNNDVDDRVLCTKDQRKGSFNSQASHLLLLTRCTNNSPFGLISNEIASLPCARKLSDVTTLRPYLFEAFFRVSLTFWTPRKKNEYYVSGRFPSDQLFFRLRCCLIQMCSF